MITKNIKILLLTTLLFVGSFDSISQKNQEPINRILFIFDASQSMLGRWQSGRKIDIARKLQVDNILDGVCRIENDRIFLSIRMLNIITGKTILIKYQLINKKKKLVSIKIPLQFNKIVFLENAEDKFIGKIISKQTINRIIKKNGIITDSLYLSALKSGVDIKTITKVIGIFSFSVDFTM